MTDRRRSGGGVGLNALLDRLLARRNARKTARVVAFCSDAVLRGRDLSVLDLGCGNGLFCHALSKLPSVARAVGVDVVNYCKAPVEFNLYSEGGRIPFADRSFDYTFLVEVLHHSNDPEHLLREAGRVTRGAVVVFEDMVTGRGRRLFLQAFDLLMNMRHGVNTPLNFRSEEDWMRTFERMRMVVRQVHSYKFYTHCSPVRSRVFVLHVPAAGNALQIAEQRS